MAHVEVPAGAIEALIDGGWLSEDQAEDPHHLGEAVLKAAEERLSRGSRAVCRQVCYFQRKPTFGVVPREVSD